MSGGRTGPFLALSGSYARVNDEEGRSRVFLRNGPRARVRLAGVPGRHAATTASAGALPHEPQAAII